MRVICIDVSNPKTPGQLLPEDYIKEGEIYTVTGEYFDFSDGHYYYYLEEKQRVPKVSYKARRFVPLSNVDERKRYVEFVKKELALL